MAAIYMVDFLPGLSLDYVIFGFHDNELRVLLLKLKNMNTGTFEAGSW